MSREKIQSIDTVKMKKRLLGVTWRSLLIGCILIPINSYWVTVIEVRYYALDGSCLPLFVTPVFMLFIVTFINFFLGKKWQKLSLTQGELLTIYIMLVISMTLSGHDTLQNMFGTIVHPFYFATPENEWADLFFRYIPKWLTITDRTVLEGFYGGESSIYNMKNFKPWIVPLTTWGIFFFALIFLLMCMSVIIRKRWTQEEKLAFPIIQLPLGMTHQRNGKLEFFTNKTMWMGFGVAGLVTTINGLHYIFPAVPYMSWIKQYDIGHYFTDRPWNALAGTRISMYPFAIGIAFFLPLDLSFSCWFFFVFRLFEKVLGSALGLRDARFPYFNEQASGAWIALALVAIWVTRRHIFDVLKKIIGLRKDLDDSNEPISYRRAVIGAILSMTLITIFCRLAGMSLPIIFAFFLIFFLLSIAMARVRAEFGAPHEIYFVNPHDMLASIIGTRRISPANLTMISMFYWFNRCNRNHPMPNHIEAFKMAESAKMSNKKLIGAMILATFVSFITTYWANLDVTYRYGGNAAAAGFKSWLGWEAFNRLQRWLINPTLTDIPSVIVMGIGLSFIAIMTAMRMRFFWWPFHPAGYALAISFAMDYFWFAFFISWLVKWIILKQGGIGTHRKAIPFFLGLILGDYVIGSIWAIVGPVMGIVNYKIFI
ncbi:MAG: DUF6785 family protein [bacterium]